MPKMKSLEDLFVHLLKNIYYAEKQILKALPKMAEKAHSAQLRKAFLHHLKETEGLERGEKDMKMRRSGCAGCQHDRRCPSH